MGTWFASVSLELPMSVLHCSLSWLTRRACGTGLDEQYDRIENLKTLIWRLPRENFLMLKTLALHLRRCVSELVCVCVCESE